MHILDRYILGEFLRKFFFLLLLFAVIMLMKNVRPIDLIQVIPVSVILAMMFSVGTLAKRKEILALHASGVSYWRMSMPLAVTVVLITLGVFAFNESVLPYCWQRVRYIEKVEIKGEPTYGPTETTIDYITVFEFYSR